MPVWQSLLQMALDTGAHAVQDCGALMAGTSNRCPVLLFDRGGSLVSKRTSRKHR